MAVKEKHSHYYKNVAHLKDIDAYRVLERFGVTDPAIQHAVKKLLVAGGRGAGKDQLQSLQAAGVGAVSVARLATPFELKDAGNATLGAVRSTGVYLAESGQAGTVQQIDLVV